jgi:hypothetical protein
MPSDLDLVRLSANLPLHVAAAVAGEKTELPTKMVTREEMCTELKRDVIPVLREMGFKGSMPHFYRVNEGNHVDLLTFQFASAGGSFVVEIGFADPLRENVYIYKDLPTAKLRISQTSARDRRRLGATDDSPDFWFAYNGTTPFGMSGDPNTIALTIRSLLLSQAVPWWDSKRR